MKSKEFLKNEFKPSVLSVFEELAQLFQKDISMVKDIARACKKMKMPLTNIEPALSITKYCQPYLNEVGIDDSCKLFRGMGEVDGFIKKSVRLTDRVPRAMTPYLFDNINAYFKKQYGAPFRTALLATGNLGHVGMFGNAYMIFPEGNFKFLWHEDVKDINFSYSDFGSHLREMGRIDGSMFAKGNVGLIGDLFMKEVVTQLDWHTTDMNAATQAGAEVMIRCKSYHGLRILSDTDINVFPKLLRIANEK